MENLLAHIKSRVSLTPNDVDLLKKYLVYEEVPAQTHLLSAGNVERFIYFLSEGIVKG